LGDRVLPVTLAIAERWGDLSALLKGKGKPRPIVDSILAATAFQHDLGLVTRNVRDYEDSGIAVLNPWDPA
jgi:predicted nucleic acid-binding protein